MRTYRSISIARAFLERAAAETPPVADITNMKLQKLVYFAQLVSVCIDKARPIHSDNTHAWDYGPVEPILYRKTKAHGSKPFSIKDAHVQAMLCDAEPVEDAGAIAIIDSVWERFKGWTSIRLSDLTHRPGSPWSITYAQNPYGIIPLELMHERKFGDV